MADQFEVEPLDDHAYLVRLREGDETVEIKFKANRGVLERAGISEADEARAVAVTAEFLIERQLAADLPSLLELDDVAAGYDDYLNELSKRLG